jgi:hypothetical protein
MCLDSAIVKGITWYRQGRKLINSGHLPIGSRHQPVFSEIIRQLFSNQRNNPCSSLTSSLFPNREHEHDLNSQKKLPDNRSVFQSAGGKRTLLDISTRNSALIKHKKGKKTTVPG